VARDRQRAKARKQRQAPQPSSRTDEGNGVTPEPDHLHRSNVPGAWEHGGEVDQFEAELVAGAEGETATDPDAAERASLGADNIEESASAGDGGARDREDRDRELLDGDGDGDGAAPPPSGGAVATAGAGEPARAQGGPRFLNFLRACWAELQRVQWPDRRQVGQATMVVLGFLIVAGAFLGAADFVANEIVNLII
jgi:preprotein translocase SecE subunit